MKKKNKKSENKKRESKLKTKWKTWMTVVSVVAGVLVISGVTILGVFLAGGLNEKIVSPDNIEFSYDGSLFNRGNNQLEVDSDFKLTIVTPTSGVTQRGVTLSFGNGIPVTSEVIDGQTYISNGSIRVPQNVSIGRAFDVHLLPAHLKDEEGHDILDDNGNYINWIAGGISTLFAKSENIQISSVSVNIAVDVPVYSTETIIINSKGEQTTQVVKNESFHAQTKFIPASSRYMYSDNLREIDENEKRIKSSYFEAVNTDSLSPVYDDKDNIHFVASDHLAENIRINSYTFASSKAELDYEFTVEEITNPEVYYTRVLTYLSENSSLAKHSSVNISIGNENIGRFTVSKEGQTIGMKAEQSLNLFMNNYAYQSNSNFLGVNVYSTSGLILDNLLKNIAISFDLNGSDPSQGVDRILTVDGGQSVDLDGIRYYKPNVNVNDIRFANWIINATDTAEITIKVVLIINDDTELFELVQGQPLVRELKLSITKHEELPVSWTDQSDVEILLQYKSVDGVSTIEPGNLNLEQYAFVPSENNYQDKVFFIWLGNGNINDYIDKVNELIGPSGYIRSRSGVYSTNNGNLTLFAVDGARLTLYNTGDFNLYFATVKPELSENGLYQIVEMCNGYKKVSCKKSLYLDSVGEYSVDMANFPEEGNEVSINQGSEKDFGITFVVGSESVPVFKDEHQKGFMKPEILDIAGNDITDYFSFDDGTLTTELEGGKATLEYRVKTRSSVQIDQINGIYLGYVSLIYDNGEDEPITWKLSLGLEKLINIYKPIASKISMAENDIYNAVIANTGEIGVEQSLGSDGNFKTTIKVTLANGTISTFNSVIEFVNRLVGANGSYITITDQKDKTDTLSGQWSFAVSGGNANIIDIALNGQSFIFRNTDGESPLSLVIRSNDSRATLKNNEDEIFEIKFLVVSQGITSILYDSTNLSTYEATPETESNDTSRAVINKYGAKGNSNQFLTLKDLIEFYCANNGNVTKYERVAFKLNPQYYSSTNLYDNQIVDLFGNNGMLTLYSNDQPENFNNDFTANNIRNRLASIEINKIKINKNFASTHVLQFIASDSSGAVNTVIDLTLKSNLAVTNENYSNEYAGDTNNIVLNNTVSNLNSDTKNEKLNSLFEANTSYYIVRDDTRYVLRKTSEVEADSSITDLDSYVLGVFNANNNTVTFKDFWEVEEKTFIVYFQPEGNNYFALNHPITFTVKRDLQVVDQGASFFVLGDERSIGEFVLLKRHDGTNIENLQISYKFSHYLTYENAKVRKTNADFFFDYNVKELYTTLTVSHGATIFSELKITIKLYDTDDIYSLIASKFKIKTLDTSPFKGLTAQTQIVNNGEEDVEYIVIPMNASDAWVLESIDGYDIIPVQRDHSGNRIQFYMTDEKNINITGQAPLLYGLDDKTKYIVINLQTGATKHAMMHLPIILSNIGFESVVYDGEKVADNHKLETALLKPEELLKKGIYNEIDGGRLTQILKEYEMTTAVEVEDNTVDGGIRYDYVLSKLTGGLYTLADFSQYINIYPLDEEYVIEKEDDKDITIGDKYKIYTNLAKPPLVTKVDDKFAGFVTLNHLANNIEQEVFIAFEYVLEKSGNQEHFYYLLKVNPDVHVEKSLYAYNGGTEYIEGSSSEYKRIDLEELFDNKTLNSGKKRFMLSKLVNLQAPNSNLTISTTNGAQIMFRYDGKEVSKEFDRSAEDITIDLKNDTYFGNTLPNDATIEIIILKGNAKVYYNEIEMISTLRYTNEVTTVVMGDRVMTSERDWREYLDIFFEDDYRTLVYRPLVSTKMTITIEHSYNRTSENELSVLEGKQIYTFILNEDSEVFSVQFVTDKEQVESDDYSLTLENGKKYGTGDENIYSMNINLIKKEESGSTIGTIVRDRLNISVLNGKENIKGYNYNTSTGEFNVTLQDYIDSDKRVTFVAYTTLGYLASFTIDLKSNVTYYPNPETTLNGGGEYIINSDFINLKQENILLTSFVVEDIEVTGQGSEYIKYDSENRKLIVADLISDMNINIRFTIKFEGLVNMMTDGARYDIEKLNGKIFVFSQDYILKQNITPKSSVVENRETIAKTEHEINLTDFYKGELNENTIIEVSTNSSNPAFAGLEGNIIKTNYVSNKSTLELTLEVTLKFAIDENTYSSQNFVVTYSFVVAPSVKLNVNYPVPNNSTKMNFEYLENGSEFTSITSFLQASPVFNNNARLMIYSAELDENGIAIYENPLTTWEFADTDAVILSSQSNAEVKQGTRTVNTNEKIDKSPIIFNRGLSGGMDSEVELSITYQSVSLVYNIRILQNSLTLSLQSVSNFTQAGEFPQTKQEIVTNEDGSTTIKETTETISVTYEKIYVDKTSTQDIFAGERLVLAQLNDSMSSYANDYYFIFTDNANSNEGNLYLSYPVYISSNDQSKNLYYDLGQSFYGKTFVGLYLASNIEDAKIPKEEDRKLEITKQEFSNLNLTNFDRSLFKVEEGKVQVSLASRIQMIYGTDNNGKDILVDYQKYKEIFEENNIYKEFNITKGSGIDKIIRNEFNYSFNRNDGSNKNSVDFNFNYYYMASIDVEIQKEANIAGQINTLYVNQEYPSIISLLGIHHPTTGRALSAVDFTQPGSELNFDILYANLNNSIFSETLDEKTINILKEYQKNEGISLYKRSVKDSGVGIDENIYLYNRPIGNTSKNVFDYSLIPKGAKNLGDYVLGKITYKSGEFSKVSYVIFKILPDYQVTYNNSSDNAGSEENGTIVSNIEKPTTISAVSDSYYSAFYLTGQEGYVSIKHKYGDDTRELSVLNFDIDMVLNQTIDSITYNNKDNIKKKIFYSSSPNLDSSSETGYWTLDNSENLSKFNYTKAAYGNGVHDIQLKNVYSVTFGDQNYFYEGVDAYGFKYRFYFKLRATKQTPSIVKNNIEIVEEGYFDLGALYKELTIEKQQTSSSDSAAQGDSYTINAPSSRTPVTSGADVKLINFEEIEAYQFAEDYTNLGAGRDAYFKKNAEKTEDEKDDLYAAKVNITNLDTYNKYPLINYLSVQSIKMFYPNTTLEPTDITTGDGNKSLSPSEKGWVFATNGVGFFGNEERNEEGTENPGPRDTYSATASSDETVPAQTDTLWQIPKLTNTDIYQGSNSAKVKLIITLEYNPGLGDNMIELCECPIEITVLRKATFNQAAEKVIVDGESFEVDKKISISKENENDSPTIKNFLNDTLEVLVPNNSNITFEMMLERENEEPRKTSVPLHNTGTSFAKTNYISISSYFGLNVKAGDNITITNCTNSSTKFFYITDPKTSVGTITDNTFTISTITHDIVYIENAELISSGSYKVTKHYIANCSYDKTGNNEYAYRVSAQYWVTGKAYQLEKNFIGNIGHVLILGKNDLSDWWADAFNLYNGSTKDDSIGRGAQITSVEEDYWKYFKFSLVNDEIGGGIGLAEVNSNGTIMIKEGFTVSTYIKVQIELSVSGPNRNIEDYKGSRHPLGQIDLSIKLTSSDISLRR